MEDDDDEDDEDGENYEGDEDDEDDDDDDEEEEQEEDQDEEEKDDGERRWISIENNRGVQKKNVINPNYNYTNIPFVLPLCVRINQIVNR